MTTDVKSKLVLLVTLQEKDAAIDKLRLLAQVIPVQIQEQNEMIARLRTELDEKKKGLVQLQLSRKEKEMELDAKEQQIRKHGQELGAVKSNDAYRAILVEIESCKQDKSALESAILEFMDKIDASAVQQKKDEAGFREQEARVKAGITSLEGELKGLQEQIAQKEAERNEYARQIPVDVVNMYDRIREGREGIAIAPLEGYTCGACHMELRPQLVNEVFKGQEVVVCDSCSRILYKK